MITKPTPAQVREARIKMGMNTKQAAERFGFSLQAWQAKETEGKTSRGLAAGSYGAVAGR